MLLVVLLKEKPEPLALLESDAIASVVVNSLKNREYDYLIFTGNKDNLEKLSQSVKTKKFNNEDPREEILKLCEPLGCKEKDFSFVGATSQEVVANLMFEGLTQIEAGKIVSYIMDKDATMKVGNYKFGCKANAFFHNCVVTASLPEEAIPEKPEWDGPGRSPSKTSYPAKMNMTDANKRCWQYVVKNHLGTIRAKFPDSLGHQWIATMILYQRVCLAIKLRPWAVDTKKGVDTTQGIRDKLVLEDEKADVLIDKIFSHLMEDRLVSRLEDLKYVSVEKSANKRILVFSKSVSLLANVNGSEVIDYLRNNYGWTKSRGAASVEVSTITDITFKMEDGKAKFFIYYTLPLTSAQHLIEGSGMDVDNGLHKLMKIWMETGRLRFRKKDL